MSSTPEASTKKPPLLLYTVIALVVAGVAYGAYRYIKKETPPPVSHDQTISLNDPFIDLSRPEILFSTQNLSELPRDIVKMPLLSGLIDEQLVFYYEEHEAKRSIEGALKRIAFEHQLDFQDRLMAEVLSAPADIALWRSGKGRAEYFIARVKRGALAKLLDTAAKVALDDKQLKNIGQFSANGQKTSLYALSYGGGRTLGFAAQGDQWVFISPPSLLFDAPRDDVQAMLDQIFKGENPWEASLPTDKKAKHSLSIGQNALTLGYGQFVPALLGMRVDFNPDSGWQMSLRAETEDSAKKPLNMGAIWRGLPLGAAFCSALPIDWENAQAPLEKLLGKNETLTALTGAMDPVSAVCWYPNARFSAPLFVARATDALPPKTDELLGEIAAKAWAPKVSLTAADKKASDAVFVKKIRSYHGVLPERRFEVTIARHGEWLYFSPDSKLVKSALAVAKKQAPALGDEAGFSKPAWGMMDIPALSKLIRLEVSEALPASEESFFRNVAQSQLWPRLSAWGQQQSQFVFSVKPQSDKQLILLDATALKSR